MITNTFLYQYIIFEIILTFDNEIWDQDLVVQAYARSGFNLSNLKELDPTGSGSARSNRKKWESKLK